MPRTVPSAGALLISVAGLAGLWVGGWDVGRDVVIGALAFAIAGAIVILLYRAVHGPALRVAEFARRVEAGEVSDRAPVFHRRQAGTLARVLNRLLDDRDTLLAELAARDATAKRTVARQRADATLIAAIDGLVAACSDVGDLTEGTVAEIQAHLGLDFAGLYLLRDDGQGASLRAGTGEAGRVLMARRHWVQLGVGVVGGCLADGRARVVRDVASILNRSTFDVLPDVRVEAAVPLRSRGAVLGAISVQSAVPDTVDERLMALLQQVADRVAIAVDGACLSAERRDALPCMEDTRDGLGRDRWGEALSVPGGQGFEAGPAGVRALEPLSPDRWPSDLERVWRGQQPAVSRLGADADLSLYHLALPIQGDDEVLGVLDVAKPADRGDWTPAELRALDGLAEQLGQALEGARYREVTRRRLLQERAAAEVPQRLHASLDVDTVLQTAVHELQELLDLDAVEVRVGPVAPAPGAEEIGNGHLSQPEDQRGYDGG